MKTLSIKQLIKEKRKEFPMLKGKHLLQKINSLSKENYQKKLEIKEK